MKGSDPARAIGAAVAVLSRHAVATLVVIGALTIAAFWYASDQLRINSDLGALIRQEGSWRQDFERFKATFPMLVDTALVVVSSRSFQDLEDTSRRLERALRDRQTLRDVYAPANDPFFRDHALLYLDVGDLETMADRLARAQPVLTAIAEDPSLRGVLDLLIDGIEHEPPAGFERIVDLLADSAGAILRGEPGAVPWTDEFFSSDAVRHRVIFVKGRADFGAALPNAVVMREIRDAIAKTRIEAGVDVRVTGEIALAHEEIGAAQQGVALAGTVSVVLLGAILVFGIRSARIVAVIFLLLGAGVVWTTAWAMLAVGEFNTLSLVFLAMFFGIGVDFSIHFCLRYEEALVGGDDNLGALRRAAEDVGGAIALCAGTTMIGFLGFVPTDYGGLADLGVISAGGVLIAALLTFSLIPAFFAVVGPPRRLRAVEVPTAETWVRALIARRRVVLPGLAVATVAALAVGTHAHFDYSVLALRDPDSESMRTLRLLEAEGIVTDYSLSVLGTAADGDASLRRVAELPVVAEVRNAADVLPGAQVEKLAVISDLSLLLGAALEPARAAPAATDADRAAAVARFLAALDEGTPDPDLTPMLRRLASALEALVVAGPGALRSFELGVVSRLATELDWLRRAIAIDAPLSFEDLPEAMRERLRSADGEYLSQVLPARDLSRVENLSAFVEEVRAVAPHATGRPVIEWGVGSIVLRSFLEALTLAVVGIAAILFVTLKSVRDTLLVMLPLTLAAVFTVAFQVLFDLPFNMANVLVLPLIFGLGVDNGIHVVDRFRRAHDVDRLMHSSTPRAVLLSTLTTVATFAALMLSPHRGTASIGALLSVSVVTLLLFAVLVLPVLLSLLRERT